MFKKNLLSLAVAMAVLPLAACNNNDMAEPADTDMPAETEVVTDTSDETVVIDENDVQAGSDMQSIAKVATQNDNLTTLTAALQASGLDQTLMDESKTFTVFAPTDDAFAALLDNLGVTQDELLADQDMLKKVLSYHVIADQNVKAADIPYGDSLKTVNGEAFVINDDNTIMDASGNSMRIVQPDVMASNGVVHVIDGVLMPADKSIVEVAQNNNDLSVLVEAVKAAGMADTLADTDSTFTVFAPTNAAFTSLLDELNMSKDDLLANTDLLTQVLSYHVIKGDRIYASDVKSGEQGTLEGSMINFDDMQGITDARDRNVKIAKADVQANNGVIHVIDKVMLPKE